MKMVTFVHFKPRHIMILKIMVVLLIAALIVPKIAVMVREIFAPGVELEEPIDTETVDKITVQSGRSSTFMERFWFNLKEFYRSGINIFLYI